jgi:hypothetical protein
MTTELSPAVIEALSVGMLPDVVWKTHDDLCDCVYQRIGMWTNPYLAETLEVRMCCIWAKLYEQYPEYVRTIPAFWDYNADEWVTEPAEWNGEEDMPAAIWHRQIARKYGVSVSQAREMHLEPPRGRKREPKPLFLLPWSGEWVAVELGA